MTVEHDAQVHERWGISWLPYLTALAGWVAIGAGIWFGLPLLLSDDRAQRAWVTFPLLLALGGVGALSWSLPILAAAARAVRRMPPVRTPHDRAGEE